MGGYRDLMSALVNNERRKRVEFHTDQWPIARGSGRR
jgi:hypothetical protein